MIAMMLRRTFLRTAAGAATAAAASAALGLPVARRAAADPVADAGPMTVFKSPYCGCCAAWVDHVRAAGFTVDVRETDNLAPVKAMAGVPDDAHSCHTATIDGYVVEGHVPADRIARLLAERPAIAGIAVPGMPIGSPGMEGPGAQPYRVVTFTDRRVDGVWDTVVP
jgi:hypothetical protein